MRKMLIASILLGVFITFSSYFFTQKKQVSPTFSVPIDRTNQAIAILDAVPEIQQIRHNVLKAGRTPFYITDKVMGSIIVLSLHESFPEDQHTNRIETFTVDMDTQQITVYDVVNNNEITLKEWQKHIGSGY